MKPMLAALLAVSSAIAFSSVARAESFGTYYIRSAPAAVLDAPLVQTQSAVIAPATTAVTTVQTQSALIEPATTTLTTLQAPLLEQTLIMPAVLSPLPGFSMDAAALSLYTGPRLENTLTMPDSATYLRGY